jgi:hypothetical protein
MGGKDIRHPFPFLVDSRHSHSIETIRSGSPRLLLGAASVGILDAHTRGILSSLRVQAEKGIKESGAGRLRVSRSLNFNAVCTSAGKKFHSRALCSDSLLSFGSVTSCSELVSPSATSIRLILRNKKKRRFSTLTCPEARSVGLNYFVKS